ncbi:MAG: U32 family peptidase [Deltaproteobacteria bacterium]|nr:U32 family peptidase [Deltaproteobacteria bacterium]
MVRVRIVAGIGGGGGAGGELPEAAVARLAAAGADELFVGYVPATWRARYGFEASPNRRYRAQSQVTDDEALARVGSAAAAAGVPWFVTLNEHALVAEQLPLAGAILDAAAEAGARGVLLAALELAPWVRTRRPGLALAASGDAPVCSRAGLDLAARLGFSRVILPRETTLAEAAALAAHGAGALGLEIEAFALGEWCVYDGATCMTCHGYGRDKDFCSAHRVRLLSDLRGGPARPLPPPGGDGCDRTSSWRGACALCALPALVRAGVTHVKVPGRSVDALDAVALVRRVIDGCADPAEVRAAMDDPAFCDGSNCRFEEA